MKLVPEIAQFHDEMTAWRRDIHAHPELGFEENRTAAMVAEKLQEFGMEVYTGIGKTGVVGARNRWPPESAARPCQPSDQPTGSSYPP